MSKKRIAVFVSGGGTNLQALMDAEDKGILHSGEIVLVVASNPNAYALTRAAKKGIATAVAWKRELGSQEAFEAAIVKVLAEHRQNTERQNELAKIGVTDDEYNSREFQEFMSKFNPKTPISEIHALYAKTQPKKDIKPMGSMKSGSDTSAKDYYSPEEIAKLSMEDLKDPKVWETVRRSMTGK